MKTLTEEIGRRSLRNEVARELLEISRDSDAINLLKAVDRGRKVPVGDKDAIRRLRDLHLVAHEGEFLASADNLRVTGWAVMSCSLQICTLSQHHAGAPAGFVFHKAKGRFDLSA
jgi:hypothetical protein